MGVQKITLLFFTFINLVPFTFIHVVPFTFIHLGPGTWYFLSPVLSLLCLSSSSPLLLLPSIASKMIMVMVKVDMVSGGNTKSQISTMLKSVSFIYLIVQLVPNLNSSAN